MQFAKHVFSITAFEVIVSSNITLLLDPTFCNSGLFTVDEFHFVFFLEKMNPRDGVISIGFTKKNFHNDQWIHFYFYQKKSEFIFILSQAHNKSLNSIFLSLGPS